MLEPNVLSFFLYMGILSYGVTPKVSYFLGWDSLALSVEKLLY
jgi:hypothetical protein